jgi:hypothetical protein
MVSQAGSKANAGEAAAVVALVRISIIVMVFILASN